MRPANEPTHADALGRQLRAFGERVREQIPALLRGYEIVTADGLPGYVDAPGLPRRVRPWCDAVEIAAMFGQVPAGRSREGWIETLRGFQHPETGLVPEHIPEDAARNPPPAADPRREDRYNTMILHYALECLGSRLAGPVTNAEAIDATALVQTLESLPWTSRAWSCGHWVDTFASCLCANRKYFAGGARIDTLFAWLDAHCDPDTGLWGAWREEDRWLQPVNGFYRLTRGTYAQFGRALPHARATVGTILLHAEDAAFFGHGAGTACNVLDVVHPLWLCLRQEEVSRGETLRWVIDRLPVVLTRWQDNLGMVFDPARDGARPGLQGTEMWLSIIYLMADLLGLAAHLGYRPQGVHRLEPDLRA